MLLPPAAIWPTPLACVAAPPQIVGSDAVRTAAPKAHAAIAERLQGYPGGALGYLK